MYFLILGDTVISDIIMIHQEKIDENIVNKLYTASFMSISMV